MAFAEASLAVSVPVATMAGCGSIYTTLALTMDRAICVIFPLRYSSWCSKTRVRLIQVVVFLWSVFLCVPTAMSYVITEQFDWNSNSSTYIGYMETEFENSHFNLKVYRPIINPIFYSYLPTAAITFLNIAIVVALRRRDVRAKEMMSQAQSEDTRADTRRITLQVLAISTFTIFVQGLRGAMFAMYSYYGTTDGYDTPLPVMLFGFFRYSFFLVHSSVNFFFYCLFGKRFRKRLAKAMCCLKQH